MIKIKTKVDARISVLGNSQTKRFSIKISLSSSNTTLEAFIYPEAIESAMAGIEKARRVGWICDLEPNIGLSNYL